MSAVHIFLAASQPQKKNESQLNRCGARERKTFLINIIREVSCTYKLVEDG